MQHVAVDLGGTMSQVCIRTLEGTILHEGKVATRDLGRFFKRQPHSRVVVETARSRPQQVGVRIDANQTFAFESTNTQVQPQTRHQEPSFRCLKRTNLRFQCHPGPPKIPRHLDSHQR